MSRRTSLDLSGLRGPSMADDGQDVCISLRGIHPAEGAVSRPNEQRMAMHLNGSPLFSQTLSSINNPL
jgi:hypothetical protein